VAAGRRGSWRSHRCGLARQRTPRAVYVAVDTSAARAAVERFYRWADDVQGKRVGHGFRNFANYRLRLLLHCGITWQSQWDRKTASASPTLDGIQPVRAGISVRQGERPTVE
jgi:hypothetical protein